MKYPSSLLYQHQSRHCLHQRCIHPKISNPTIMSQKPLSFSPEHYRLIKTILLAAVSNNYLHRLYLRMDCKEFVFQVR